jgi:hypothetical protein
MIYKNFLLPATLGGAHDNELRVYVQYENDGVTIDNITFIDTDYRIQPIITIFKNNFYLIDPFILDYIKNYHLIEIIKKKIVRDR